MCGIAGVLHRKKAPDVREECLVKMADTLIHRGPDSAGVFVNRNRTAGMGFRRLSIIDVRADGDQPMKSACGDTWIVFNGEIYNYRELKQDLKKEHTFVTQTDTEVLLHLYEHYGVDMLNHLDGMFAFAIWDGQRQRFFCARDHMGIKPFYYHLSDQMFVFGSEIKAILAHPDISRNIHEPSILSYLTFACIPAPYTLFSGIAKLGPGEYIIISAHDVSKKRYWSPVQKSFDQKEEPHQRVRAYLETSIKKQMVSDVPFGSFLSGGVDSSAIAVLMSRFRSSPLDVFSVGIRGLERYNEFPYSRMIATRIGATAHEIFVGEEDFFEFIQKFAWHADDPNGDPVCFPLYYLSRSAKQAGMKMVQVGEGADELFAGYQSYLNAVRVWDVFWRHGRFLPPLVKRLMYAVSLSRTSSFLFKNQEIMYRFAHGKELFWGGAIAFTESARLELTSERLHDLAGGFDPYSVIHGHYSEMKSLDPRADILKRLTYLDFHVRLSELLLMRIDKMTMAHGLEARVPFLDRNLVSYALSIPYRVKVPKNQGKYLLKKSLEDLLPAEILSRKKQGFGAPISEWLRKERWNRHFLHMVQNSFFCREGLFRKEVVQRLFLEHQEFRSDNAFQLWNLISLVLWYDEWIR